MITGRGMMRACVALLLTAALILPAGRRAVAVPWRPELTSFTVPAAVAAGEPFTITATARAPEPTEEMCCARVGLVSPSGKQQLTIFLERAGYGGLTATITFPAGAESGRWRVAWLDLIGNSLVESRMEYGAGFQYQFEVTASAPDLTAPKLSALGWAVGQVQQGAPVRLVARPAAGVSDISAITVTVAPEMNAGTPLWTRTVRLEPTAGGTWEGTFLAPVTATPTGRVLIDSATVSDAAGNATSLKRSDLEALGARPLAVAPAKVPAGLVTEPYLINLLHIGAFTYLDWNDEDLTALGKLWDQMLTDPAGARAELNYQLMALNVYVETLRKEIYTDAQTGYRYVPLATSGKWRAVDKAMQARSLMLVELARRAGQNQAQRLEKDDLLGVAVLTTEPGETLEPVDPSYLSEAGALMAAVIDTVRRSGLPKGLMTAAHRDAEGDSLNFRDPGLIWFQPFTKSGVLAEHYDDDREIYLYFNRVATPQQVIEELFHELGHHFTSAFVGDSDARYPSRSIWMEYLQLRSNPPWFDQAGWAGLPWENFAEDFAYAYLPDDLRFQYGLRQMYPHLDTRPEMLKAFRDWVAKRAATQPAYPIEATLSPLVVLPDGLEPTATLQIPADVCKDFGSPTAPPQCDQTRIPRFVCVTQDDPYHLQPAQPPVDRLQYPDNRSRLYLSCPAVQGRNIRFDVLTVAVPGEPARARLYPVLPFPAATGEYDPVAPRVTDQQTLLLINQRFRQSGSWSSPMPLDRKFTLLINGVKKDPRANWSRSTDDLTWPEPEEGRVELAPGDNQLDIRLEPQPLADAKFWYASAMSLDPYVARAHVYYELPDKRVPLSVQALPTVSEDRVLISGATDPHTLVRSGDSHTVSDANGQFAFWRTGLSQGAQMLTVSAFTPAGKETQATAEVTYTAAWGLQADLPAVTNERYLAVSGTAEGASRVTVNGTNVATSSDGHFTTRVTLKTGPNQVEVTATNAEGRTARVARTVTLNTALVPMLALGPTVDWTGQAPPGTTVSFAGNPVPLESGGAYRVRLNVKEAGTNTFRLDFISPGQAPYYYEVSVVRPVLLDVPTHTNLPVLSLEGRLAAPAELVLDGIRITPQPNGRFRANLNVNQGESTALLYVSKISVPWIQTVEPMRGQTTERCGSMYLHFDTKTAAPSVVICANRFYRVPGGPPPEAWQLHGEVEADWSELPDDVVFGVSVPPRVTLPSSAVKTLTVKRVDMNGVLAGSDWIITLPRVGVGTRFTVRGTSVTATEAKDQLTTLRVPVKPGANQVAVDYETPGGEAAFMLFGVDVPDGGGRLELTPGSDMARLGGVEKRLPAPVRSLDDVAYAPLQFLADALGAQLRYDPDDRRITLTRAGHELVMILGETQAVLDGSSVTAPAPARIVDNRTMVPVRFVAESLGAGVSWNAETQSIIITP